MADEEVKPEQSKLEELNTPTMLEEARKVVDDLKAANEVKRGLLEREERIKAQEMLGGRSAAGEPAPEPVEETPSDYAKRVMAGKV